MSGAVSRDDSKVKIEQLLAEFYDSSQQFHHLAEFESATNLPAPYSGLLDHQAHMTVTVESFWGESVNVVVHRTKTNDHWYSREITLTTDASNKVVQYGIVRLNTKALEPVVWSRIEDQGTPLGRVLIEHNVLREVHLCELWSVQAGDSLAQHFGVQPNTQTFGRTALIYCDGEPAIELLEIVSPISDH